MGYRKVKLLLIRMLSLRLQILHRSERFRNLINRKMVVCRRRRKRRVCCPAPACNDVQRNMNEHLQQEKRYQRVIRPLGRKNGMQILNRRTILGSPTRCQRQTLRRSKEKGKKSRRRGRTNCDEEKAGRRPRSRIQRTNQRRGRSRRRRMTKAGVKPRGALRLERGFHFGRCKVNTVMLFDESTRPKTRGLGSILP